MKMPKILVVDDKEENLNAAKEYFSSLGKFEVDYATNLEYAKRKLQEGNYFLGIFDLDMPVKEEGDVKEKAGLELEKIAKEKGMFYVFYSGGFFHGTPRTRVYLDGTSSKEGARGQWTDTYSKDSARGWQELYRKLVEIGEESTNPELEKELESSIERYVKYVGKIPPIKPKGLIPYIFDKYYEIFKQEGGERK